IKWVTAPLSTLVLGPPSVYLTPPATLALNNVTGTKDHVGPGTGIFVVATAVPTAVWGFTNLDEDAPDVLAVDPPVHGGGVPPENRVAKFKTPDTGMGVRKG